MVCSTSVATCPPVKFTAFCEVVHCRLALREGLTDRELDLIRCGARARRIDDRSGREGHTHPLASRNVMVRIGVVAVCSVTPMGARAPGAPGE
jgi:hypothetical protein